MTTAARKVTRTGTEGADLRPMRVAVELPDSFPVSVAEAQWLHSLLRDEIMILFDDQRPTG